jgi:hypothetical protein
MSVKEQLSFFNSWHDSNQIKLLDEILPKELKFEGEFGSEIVTFLPFVFNLKIQGLMSNRFVSTYAGMDAYYYFLNSNQLHQKGVGRSYVAFEDRWWPHSDEHYRVKIDGEIFPIFQTKTKKRRKPIIFIQNKYCVEWGDRPINFIPLKVLEQIFEFTKNTHSIVYSRQGLALKQSQLGISLDHNTELYFEDEALCQDFSHVKILEKSRMLRSYNAKKLQHMNRADLLIGVQGGSMYPWAYFHKNAVILHVKGNEMEFSYNHGFFKFLSQPPLRLHVVTHEDELLKKVVQHLNSAE